MASETGTPKIIAVVRDMFSVYVVDMMLRGQVYTFRIPSERIIEKAKRLCRKGAPYRAFNLLMRENQKNLNGNPLREM